MHLLFVIRNLATHPEAVTYASPGLYSCALVLDPHPARTLPLVRHCGHLTYFSVVRCTTVHIASSFYLIVATKFKSLFVKWQNLLDQPGEHPNYTIIKQITSLPTNFDPPSKGV